MRLGLTLLLLGLLTACTGAHYRDGQREFGLLRIGYDTKAGDVQVETPDGGRLRIKGLDSQERASELLGKAIDKIPG